MRQLVTIVLASAVVAGCGVRAKTEPNAKAKVYAPNNGAVCLLAGAPPTGTQYEVLGRVVATKRTYGSPEELYDPMVREAQKLGADALINLQAEQRFKGPLPWRVTSPTGDGTAVKIVPDTSAFDCAQVGGRPYAPGGIIVANQQQSTPSGVATLQSSKQRPTSDKYSDLERLKKLLDQGVITQAEFDREKAKILN